MAREPRLKDVIGSMSAADYLTFMAGDKERKASKNRRKLAKLMKERGFSVFMIGETQADQKRRESA